MKAHSQHWKSLKPREKEEFLRANATESEMRLNGLLLAGSRTAFKFKFQAACCGYFADFLFKREKLIVELDGAVHADRRAKMADARRTRRLTKAGYKVIRFWNGEIREPERVIGRIVAALEGQEETEVKSEATTGTAAQTRASALARTRAVRTTFLPADFDLDTITIPTRSPRRSRSLEL